MFIGEVLLFFSFSKHWFVTAMEERIRIRNGRHSEEDSRRLHFLRYRLTRVVPQEQNLAKGFPTASLSNLNRSCENRPNQPAKPSPCPFLSPAPMAFLPLNACRMASDSAQSFRSSNLQSIR